MTVHPSSHKSLAKISGYRNNRIAPRIGAILAVLLAITSRLVNLGADSLWYDETVSAYLALQSFGDIIWHTSLDIHPPGYYLLLHAWTLIAGNSEFAFAFFSLFFGVLLVALVYRLADRLFSYKSAVLAAFLAATSSYAVWYSQEVRMYTLAACVAVVAAICTIAVIERQEDWHLSMLWAITVAVGLYVLYYLAFLFVLLSLLWLGAIVAGNRSDRRSFSAWLLAQVLALVLYIPWAPVAAHQMLTPPVPPWRSFMPLAQMLTGGANALFAGEAYPNNLWPLAILITALAILLPFLIHKGRAQRLLIVGGFAFPWAAILAISSLTPLFHPRYLFPFAPFFSVSLSAVALLPVKRWRLLSLPALCSIYLVANSLSTVRMWTQASYRPDDLRQAVRRLQEEWAPGDVIFVNAGYTYTALVYYWPGEIAWVGRVTEYENQKADTGPVILIGGSLDGQESLGWNDPRADFYATSLDEQSRGLRQALQANKRLWQLRLYDTVTDPEGDLRRWLGNEYIITEDHSISGPSFGRLQAYVDAQFTLSCFSPINWASVVETCATHTLVPSYDEVVVYFENRMLASKPAASIHYTLRLVNENGDTVAQADGLLFGSALPQGPSRPSLILSRPAKLALSPELPAGRYAVVFAVYLWEAGMVKPLSPNCLPQCDLYGDGLALVGFVDVM